MSSEKTTHKVPYRKLLTFSCLLGLAGLLFYACASGGTLSGGPRDESPPQLQKDKSTPNQQTNFEKQEIIFAFDEFIVLERGKKPFVSPPLEKPLQMSVKGRNLLLEFHEDEILEENTTYTIQLGQLVKDLNEGNQLQDLNFVFSTGAVLDSLFLAGQVRDPLSDGLPDQLSVLLYRSLQDSSFLRGEPDFLGYVDESGQFRLENLPADSFYLIVLEDLNADNIYDRGVEKMGYINGKVFPDSQSTALLVNLIMEDPILMGSKITQVYQNYYRVLVNQEARGLELKKDSSIIHYAADQDSLLVWTDGPIDSLFILGSESQDTVYGLIEAENSTFRPFYRTMGDRLAIAEGESLEILFSNPLSTVVVDSLIAMDTSEIAVSASLSEKDPRILDIKLNAQSGQRLMLIMKENAIIDVYGQQNEVDTVEIEVKKPIEYSSVFTDLYGMDTSTQYLIHLIDGQDLLQEEWVSHQDSVRLSWGRLPVKNYELEIIYDSNKNKKWDAGSFARKRQAERKVIEKIEGLRPGWDVELRIQIPK